MFNGKFVSVKHGYSKNTDKYTVTSVFAGVYSVSKDCNLQSAERSSIKELIWKFCTGKKNG